MANLYPDTTGLPMTVWVSPGGSARHDVLVKVNMTHGNQMNIADMAVVGVRPTPRRIAGELSPADTQAVFQWVALNTDVFVAYWEEQIDTARVIRGLKPLPPTGNPAYLRRRRWARSRLPRDPGEATSGPLANSPKSFPR